MNTCCVTPMPSEISTLWNDTTALVASLVGTTATAVFGFRLAVKRWASDSRDIQKISVETQIVEMLRSELVRARQHNDDMVGQLESLRGVTEELRDQVRTLKLHNICLQTQLDVYVNAATKTP